MEYKSILNSLLIAWWFTSFIPLQNFIKPYKEKYIKNFYLKEVLSCFKCLSFWVCLIYFGVIYHQFGFLEAILSAVIAYTYEKVMNSLKTFF